MSELRIDSVIAPADLPPVTDQGNPVAPSPINQRGEPRKSGPRGGRPPLSEAEKAERAAQAQANKISGKVADPSVVQALSVLNSAYGMITTGLMLLGAPNAAAALSDRIPGVQDQNKQFLTSDPKLAKRIASVGASTGRAGFALVNGGMLVTVALIAQGELSANARPKRKRPETTESGFANSEPRETPAASPMFPGA